MASGNCDGTGKAKMAAILGILPFENAKKDIMKIVVIWWLYGGEQWSSNLFDPYASHVSDCW